MALVLKRRCILQHADRMGGARPPHVDHLHELSFGLAGQVIGRLGAPQAELLSLPLREEVVRCSFAGVVASLELPLLLLFLYFPDSFIGLFVTEDYHWRILIMIRSEIEVLSSQAVHFDQLV